tara:strand:- start:454 stop:741 length:288 start_codon:yes stop_codon:yes gene_type:complete
MDARGLLGEHYHRNTKKLFKSFLILLEDLKTDHDIHFCKLRKNLPEHKALIEQADYFDEKKMQYLRKKILDTGNENIRNNDDDLEKFTIEFQFKN